MHDHGGWVPGPRTRHRTRRGRDARSRRYGDRVGVTGVTQAAATEHLEVRPVVVGVDGSTGSARALAWALREARDRRAPVRVVTAWAWGREPSHGGTPGAAPLAPMDVARKARSAQDALVRAVVARFPGPLPALSTELVQGDPASTLIERSRNGVLLVLGSRGMTGAEPGEAPCDHARDDDAVGAVADACLRHGSCPVVVVPAEPPQRRLPPGERRTAVPLRRRGGLAPAALGALGLL